MRELNAHGINQLKFWLEALCLESVHTNEYVDEAIESTESSGGFEVSPQRTRSKLPELITAEEDWYIETHAIRQGGKITESERLTVEEAYDFLKKMGDRVAESYTVYAGEEDRPVGECYEIYEEGETFADYPDGNPYAETITIFNEKEKNGK